MDPQSDQFDDCAHEMSRTDTDDCTRLEGDDDPARLDVPVAAVGELPLGMKDVVSKLDTRSGDVPFPTAGVTSANLLPPGNKLPDRYEWLTLEEEMLHVMNHPWASEERVSVLDTRAVYTPDGRQEDVLENVVCRVLLPDDSRGWAEDRDVYHDVYLRKEFGGEPSLEGFTDWIKADLTEQQVDGHRRTTYWRRVPVLRDSPARPDDEGDLPCTEFAAAVQSTDWGVIHVGVYLASAPEDGRSRRIRDEVLERFHDRVDFMPAPEPVQRAIEPTAWTDLTAVQRRDAAAETLARGGSPSATVADILEKLRRQYGPLSDDAEQLVESVFADKRATHEDHGGDARDV